MRRRVSQLFVALLVAVLPLVAAVSPARADNVGALLGLVNGLRAAHGAGPLSLDPTLTATAQMWSAHMAATGTLSHNPNYAAGATGAWTKVGENVGEGGVLTAIFTAFVNSPFHLSNMVDPSFNLTGIAVAPGTGNTLWVTQDFEARAGGPPVAPPATNPAPVTTAPPARPAPTTPPAPRPTSAPAPAATTPVAAPTTGSPSPTTAAPTTTTAPTPSAAPTVSSGSDAPATTASPLPPGAKGPGKLAASASPLSQPNQTGAARLWLLLPLAGLAVVSTVYFVRKPR